MCRMFLLISKYPIIVYTVKHYGFLRFCYKQKSHSGNKAGGYLKGLKGERIANYIQPCEFL